MVTRPISRSVQGAINHVMKYLAKETPFTIKVKNGVYNELLYVRGKDNLTILGESRDRTVIPVRQLRVPEHRLRGIGGEGGDYRRRGAWPCCWRKIPTC